jgi:hypothetical protein
MNERTKWMGRKRKRSDKGKGEEGSEIKIKKKLRVLPSTT